VWWWRPLWHYIFTLGLISERQLERGSYNDGFTIKQDKALKIAARLKHELAQGKTKKYEEEYKKELKDLPDEECDICQGTGKRRWTKKSLKEVMDDQGHPLGKLMGDTRPWKEGNGEYEEKKCNACGGKGKKRPWTCSYPFCEENVREFAEFCMESGGFSIW
jgi:hypothetical protein